MTTITPVSIMPGAVVVDANVAVAISAKEVNREMKAAGEISKYAAQGYELYAPGVLISESLYALCQKYQAGLLTLAQYEKAVRKFETFMQNIHLPPGGGAMLIRRAYEICDNYGCSRSADAVYIALAEELAQTRPTVLLTFDKELPKQAARNAPTVNIHLLVI